MKREVTITGVIKAKRGHVMQAFLGTIEGAYFDIDAKKDEKYITAEFSYNDRISKEETKELLSLCLLDPKVVLYGEVVVEVDGREVCYRCHKRMLKWKMAKELLVYLTSEEQKMLEKMINAYRPTADEAATYAAARRAISENFE